MTPEEFPQALLRAESHEDARAIARLSGVERHDTVVVLGSGLAGALESWGEPRARFPLSAIPGVLEPQADGHVDEVRSYRRASRDVLVALGRTHLYEGASASRVTSFVRAAAASGASRAVLCNANGCLRDWALGDVMAIEDHLNFSGHSPFDGTVFLDPRDTWDLALTDVVAGVCQRRGVYAILRGPEYQTRAETRWLASTGADCVGMSTVMEALTLRALGVRVAGMSVVSDLSFADAPTDPSAVVEAAARAGETVRRGIEAVLAAA
jgi:purine-nucleoside phosphorylase